MGWRGGGQVELVWLVVHVCLSGQLCSAESQFGIPAELGQYMLDTFAKDELARSRHVQEKYGMDINKLDSSYTLAGKNFSHMQNMSFRLSTTPFVTSAGFRELCFPNVLDNNGRMDVCALPANPSLFFRKIPDGSCIFMTSRCYHTILELKLLELIPHRFSIVTHYSDIAVPDMDKKQKFYGVTETTPVLQKLHDAGKLLAFHAMNMHYSNWSHPAVSKPSWLHCIPIGMRLRFQQPQDVLNRFLSAIKRNVVERPLSHWSNHSRPLLLVPVARKAYARDRGKALNFLKMNVKSKRLKMKWIIYDKLESFYDAVSEYRFILCPWGNGLDTHRIYEVLAMGGIPVVRRSSINSCVDNSDNDVSVQVINHRTGEVRTDNVHRGDIPVVVVSHWREVTTKLLEDYWTAFTNGQLYPPHLEFAIGDPRLIQKNRKEPVKWDYTRITMQHWRKRILGFESDEIRTVGLEKMPMV